MVNSIIIYEKELSVNERLVKKKHKFVLKKNHVIQIEN